MSWLRKVRLRFRALFQKQKLDAQMAEEMRGHIEMRTRQNIEAGMSADEARYAAMRQFGWVESIKDTCRDQRGVAWVENLAQDVHYGARMLRKNPIFTAVVVLTLALGLGANTAIFTILNATLLKAPAFPNPQEICLLTERNPRQEEYAVSGADFLDWRQQNRVFSRMAAFSRRIFTLRTAGEPSVHGGAAVSKDFFELTAIEPVAGHTFGEADYAADAEVVMIGEGFADSHFGNAKQAVGRSFNLNSRTLTIIGIMPDIFGPLGLSPNIWLPLSFDSPENLDRNKREFSVVARLKSGATLEEAAKQMDVIAARIATEYPVSNKDFSVSVRRWGPSDIVRESWSLLAGAAGFVLLIACTNVANLLLARGSARRAEMGIRTALGGRLIRLVRQLLTESLLLALLAGCAGLVLSSWTGRILVSKLPNDFFGQGIASTSFVLDWRVVGFALVLSMLTAVISGLSPAFRTASGINIAQVLRDAGRTISAGSERLRFSDALIVAEVALSLLLLSGAILMTKSLWLRSRLTPGFNPDRLSEIDLNLSGIKYESLSQRSDFVNEVLRRIEALPEVDSCAAASALPLTSKVGMKRYYPLNRPPPTAGGGFSSLYFQVSPSYFKTLGIPVLRGRAFTDSDRSDSPHVVVVNQNLAKFLFGKDEPIGQMLVLPEVYGLNPCEIVGVVKNVDNLVMMGGATTEWALYVPLAQDCWPLVSLAFRSKVSASKLVRTVHKEVIAVDPDLPVILSRTMKEFVSDNLKIERALSWHLGSFALIGFLLAIVGIGSVVGNSVSQRTHEIGIRMALGATKLNVLTLVLKRGMIPVAIGLLIGLAGSLGLHRLFWSFFWSRLYGITKNEPITFSLTIAVFATAALIGCCVPARRAMKVDPMVALIYE